MMKVGGWRLAGGKSATRQPKLPPSRQHGPGTGAKQSAWPRVREFKRSDSGAGVQQQNTNSTNGPLTVVRTTTSLLCCYLVDLAELPTEISAKKSSIARSSASNPA